MVLAKRSIMSQTLNAKFVMKQLFRLQLLRWRHNNDVRLQMLTNSPWLRITTSIICDTGLTLQCICMTLFVIVTDCSFENPALDWCSWHLVSDEIRSVVGQTRLLLDERFTQFQKLIDRASCKVYGDVDDRPVLVSDLQGFWDMVLYQVSRFCHDMNVFFCSITCLNTSV